MTSEAWQTFGNFATTAGITSAALTTGVKYAVKGYQNYASPYSSITGSEKKLERIKSRLHGLSPQQREEIATRSESSTCTSLACLEDDLVSCVLLIDAVSFELKFTVGISSLTNMYYRINKRYEEATFRERHNPYSQFRIGVARLENHAKALLNDTLVKISYHRPPI